MTPTDAMLVTMSDIYDAILAEMVRMGDGPFMTAAANERYARLLRAAVYMASRNNR